jgi:hypothetical protein
MARRERKRKQLLDELKEERERIMEIQRRCSRWHTVVSWLWKRK